MQQPQKPEKRRLLYPFSGNHIVTGKEATGLALRWGLLFGIPMALLTLPVTIPVIGLDSLSRILLITLATFVFSLLIFGGTAYLVVGVGNRANRLTLERQQQKKANEQQSSGGSNGSQR